MPFHTQFTAPYATTVKTGSDRNTKLGYLNMTFMTDTHPPKATIIGEYSLWPQKPAPRRRIALFAGAAGTLGVFVHCVLPMMIGA